MRNSITSRAATVRTITHPQRVASRTTIALTHTLDIITIILCITIRIGNQIITTIINIRRCTSRNTGKIPKMWSKCTQALIYEILRSGLTNRKNRRHANDAVPHPQDKVRKQQHSLTYSSSQLSIEVSKLHAGANGRLEITCVSTIPATIAPLEQYADYKSTSVKGLYKLYPTITGCRKNSQGL